jgi:hypothetical protein
MGFIVDISNTGVRCCHDRARGVLGSQGEGERVQAGPGRSLETRELGDACRRLGARGEAQESARRASKGGDEGGDFL